MADHDSIDKKALSERDICTKFITPAIREVAGWNDLQFLEEPTLGKIHVRGKGVARGVRDRAGYIIFYKKHLPLAIIETKDKHHEIGAGMQQAVRYSNMLDILLKSAEGERGRLVESVLGSVAGQYGE
jgi:type I restriction enzyme R subunit